MSMVLVLSILEIDIHLNAAVDVLKTCIAQNYKGTEEFCDRFSSTFNPVAPSIMYMWISSVMLKTPKHFYKYYYCASPPVNSGVLCSLWEFNSGARGFECTHFQ